MKNNANLPLGLGYKLKIRHCALTSIVKFARLKIFGVNLTNVIPKIFNKNTILILQHC